MKDKTLDEQLEYLKGIGIKEINKTTRLATNKIDDILQKRFDKIEDVRAKGFVSMLEREYHVILLNATENISAISADFTEAQILRIPIGSPLLLVRRISCTEQGPFEYAFIKIVADKYEYSVYLEGRSYSDSIP